MLEGSALRMHAPCDLQLLPPQPPPCCLRLFPLAFPSRLVRRSGEHRTLVTKPDQPAPAAQQPAHAARGAVPFVRGAAFDASGSRLLAGSEDKASGLRLWDASSWELLQSM